MKKQQSGFTLIELVVVIVILGILAATALPKFVDLKSDAAAAATAGVAGALASAATTNYGARTANATKGSAIANCSDVANVMAVMPAGYTISGPAMVAGAVATCTLTGTNSTTTVFTAIGIS